MVWTGQAASHAYLGRYNMAAIPQSTDNIFRCIFVNEKFCILIQISLKFVPKGPIDNNSVLVQVMASRRSGDKPFPEPLIAQFTDTCMQH